MSKDDILPKGAILQRDYETYAITARLLGGVMDVATARRIADTAEKYGAKILKVTGDQRLALVGIKEEDIDAAYENMGIKPVLGTALCQQFIKACPGNTFCVRGQQDALGMARKIQERFYPFPKIKSKVKVGISGCFNSCSEPAIKDIGLVGLPKGWTLMIGGAGGQDPMIAEIIARNLSDDQVLEVYDKLMKFYRGASQQNVTRNMRLGVIMKRQGTDRIKQICGLD